MQRNEVKKGQYYVYRWFIKDTHEIFYIGKGINERCFSTKDRNDYFKRIVNKHDCDVEIITYCESESEAFEKEKEYIAYYKSLGLARANFHEGGFGGSPLKYASEEKKAKFREKMTEINRARCATEAFKEQAREHMVQRYTNPIERQKQAEKQKKAWTKDKRKEQSERVKEIYQTTNLKQIRSENQSQKCVFELGNVKIEFPSRKDALNYIKETYGLVMSRKMEQDMLHNKASYISFRKKYKHLDGMKLYYV